MIKKIDIRGDSQMLSPWLFLVLGLIAVSIVTGVLAYFSGTADVRIVEAKTMSDKIVYGISDGGYLKDNVLDGNFDILAESGIEPKVLDNGGYFYLNISIYNGDKLEKSFLKGNGDFEIQCRLKGDKLAKCYYRELILSYRKNSILYKIKVLTGSNNAASI